MAVRKINLDEQSLIQLERLAARYKTNLSSAVNLAVAFALVSGGPLFSVSAGPAPGPLSAPEEAGESPSNPVCAGGSQLSSTTNRPGPGPWEAPRGALVGPGSLVPSPLDSPPPSISPPRQERGKGGGAGGTIQPNDTADFEVWYAAYPRKVARNAAKKAWERSRKIRPPLAEMLRVLEAQKQSRDWTQDGGAYIPHPATYLNQGRWADEVATVNAQLALVPNARPDTFQQDYDRAGERIVTNECLSSTRRTELLDELRRVNFGDSAAVERIMSGAHG